jgi:hypothetical protein
MTGIIAIPAAPAIQRGRPSGSFPGSMQFVGFLMFQTPHAGESSNLRYESYFGRSFVSLFG